MKMENAVISKLRIDWDKSDRNPRQSTKIVTITEYFNARSINQLMNAKILDISKPKCNNNRFKT